MRVLIVPDKFKGTLTAQEAADAIARGWLHTRPGDEVERLPMSDGGDGFGEIIGKLMNAEGCVSQTVNAAHETIEAQWWWSATHQTAIVESAKIIGLAMLPPGRFHPVQLDTYGLGHLLRQIASEHPSCRLLVGIGGSATNDAGFGLARGLGFHFEDASGYCVDRWLDLDRLLHISPPENKVQFSKVIVACDVQNPLLGPEGATRIYGPQKGMRPEDFPLADRCFSRLCEVVQNDLKATGANTPGAGAAGGLGYGLRVFTNAQFESGFEIFARASKLQERIAGADLVVTGEGAIDRQTEMGKGTGAVAALARTLGKRCLGLAGILKEDIQGDLFSSTFAIVPKLAASNEAIQNAAFWLERLSREAAKGQNSDHG